LGGDWIPIQLLFFMAQHNATTSQKTAKEKGTIHRSLSFREE
jgi:hypothetical protein